MVIGSGIAGLSAARVLGAHGQTLVVTKGALREGSTHYAQGGIAVAMAPSDTPAHHLEDTLNAGDGLCDTAAVQVLVEEGPARVRELILLGAQFDRDGEQYAYTRKRRMASDAFSTQGMRRAVKLKKPWEMRCSNNTMFSF